MENAEMIDKIKELMKNQKLTQKELAERTHITEASMSKYLSGERTPRIDVISNLSQALGVTADYLLGSESYEGFESFLTRSKDKLTSDQKKKIIRLLVED